MQFIFNVCLVEPVSVKTFSEHFSSHDMWLLSYTDNQCRIFQPWAFQLIHLNMTPWLENQYRITHSLQAGQATQFPECLNQ